MFSHHLHITQVFLSLFCDIAIRTSALSYCNPAAPSVSISQPVLYVRAPKQLHG